MSQISQGLINQFPYWSVTDCMQNRSDSSDHPDKNTNLPCATVGMPHQSFKWSLNHMASTRLAVSPQTYASDDVFVHQLAVLSTRRTVAPPSDALSRSRPCHSLVVDIPSNNCKVTKNGDFPTEDFHRGGLPLISYNNKT